jgi:replicative DNA helicase
MTNEEIEKTLLGKLIVNNELYEKYSNLLHEELFVTPFNKSVYIAFIKLMDRGQVADLLTLGKLIKGDQVIYNLSLMTDDAFSFTDITTCIAILEEEFQKRILFGIVSNVNNQLSEREELEIIIGGIEKDMSKLNTSKGEELADLDKQLNNMLGDIEVRMNSEGLLGIPTGFKDIDKFTGGWQETDLIIVGGASSMGKTSFALALAFNAAKYSKTPTVIFSYEMSSPQLLKRLISVESGVNNSYIANGTIGDEELKRIHKATTTVSNTPINIDECNITSLNYLIYRIKEYVKTRKVKLVMVDYLQLVSYSSKKLSREQEVSKVARKLKNLAKELNITIIALSQLNRGVGMRNNSKPTLSDLRESGEIEQAADIVMLIYRPEYYGLEYDDAGHDAKGIANIIFAKGRNIGVGEVTLKFISNLTKFENYEK